MLLLPCLYRLLSMMNITGKKSFLLITFLVCPFRAPWAANRELESKHKTLSSGIGCLLKGCISYLKSLSPSQPSSGPYQVQKIPKSYCWVYFTNMYTVIFRSWICGLHSSLLHSALHCYWQNVAGVELESKRLSSDKDGSEEPCYTLHKVPEGKSRMDES